MIETLTTKICSTKPIEEPIAKRILRKAIEVIKPTFAVVRYDTAARQWAVLDEKTLQPTRHFQYGVMKQVTFRSENVKVPTGCGGGTSINYAGIASGYLYTDTHGNDVSGFKNFSFNNGQFQDVNGNEVKSASVLRLMSNRTALYKD